MGVIKAIKLLLDLRRGWKSKTVWVNRILALLGALDASYFQGGLGRELVELVIAGASYAHIMLNEAQAVAFLLFVVANIYSWLREHTSEPVAGK